MAASHAHHAPAIALALFFHSRVKTYTGIEPRPDICALGDAVAGAGQMNGIGPDAIGLGRHHGIDPGHIFGRLNLEIGGGGRGAGDLATRDGGADALLHLRGDKIERRLAILGHEGVEENEGGDAILHGLRHQRDHHARIGMTDEADVAQLLETNQIADILHMGIEGDRCAHEMLALAKAGEGGREDPVAGGGQSVSHAPPAPAAMPGAVHEYEGALLRCAHWFLPWRRMNHGAA